MRPAAAAILSILLSAAAAAAAEMTVEEAFAAARRADVLFVGEVHDNPAHHEAQARLAAGLAPRAIVFEMIDPADEAALAGLRHAGAPRDRLAEALDWEASGWPDFDLYAPIMEAAPEAVILGAQAGRDAVRRAVAEGAAKAFGPGAARYGLDTPLPPQEQAARESRQDEAHCGRLPADLLPGMVEAQRLRDALLAAAVLRALSLPGAGPVLVITGNGHVHRGWGAPAALAAAAPQVTTFLYAQVEAGAAGQKDFDAWRVTPAPQRPDPCAAFGKE